MSISMLEPGTYAPALTLPDETGTTRMLGDWAGQWVCVWWNPVALAKGCKSCGQRIVDTVRPLMDNGVTLVGVTMSTPSENAERSLFVFEGQFPILSADWDTAAAWGAARPKDSPWVEVPHPLSYLVDPEGRIAKAWFVHHSGQAHIAEVIESITGVLV